MTQDKPLQNISVQNVREAADRIASYIHRTPVLTSHTLDERFGAHLFFKCENFQKTGSFKFRGACNAIFSMSEADAAKGVVTHSSGNFGQALARAASIRGIHARIVMPSTASATKRDAAIAYGGEIVPCEPTNEARKRTADRVIRETGALLIHSSNDLPIIFGQGTAAMELAEEAGQLDLVLAPVGGGGLLSGTALAVRGLSTGTAVAGVEPSGADDAYRSLKQGEILPSLNPKTIADGLLTSLGSNTFPIIQQHVREIVTVDDGAIIESMRLLWKRLKVVIEPSSAVPLAALLEKKLDVKGQRVGIILSGGNVDLDNLPW